MEIVNFSVSVTNSFIYSTWYHQNGNYTCSGCETQLLQSYKVINEISIQIKYHKPMMFSLDISEWKTKFSFICLTSLTWYADCKWLKII